MTPDDVERMLAAVPLPACGPAVEARLRREAARRYRGAGLLTAAAAILAFALTAWWVVATPGARDVGTPAAQDRAAELVKLLGSDDIGERERGAAELRRLGRSAIPALEIAEKAANPEVALRAKAILGEIRGPEMFAALEAGIREAATLRVALKGELLSQNDAMSYSGTLAVGRGNKVHLSLQATLEGRAARLELISDGTRLWIDFPRRGRDQTLMPAPETLREDVLSAFLRGGAFAGMKLMLETDVYRLGERSALTLKERLGLSERDVLLEDASCLAFRATYRLPAGEGELEAKVRFRPGTVPRILERTVTLKGSFPGNIPGTFRESYDAFQLNGELPDALFRVPEKEK
jgi:hypothetical protein